jgi:hypothetical protein
MECGTNFDFGHIFIFVYLNIWPNTDYDYNFSARLLDSRVVEVASTFDQKVISANVILNGIGYSQKLNINYNIAYNKTKN